MAIRRLCTQAHPATLIVLSTIILYVSASPAQEQGAPPPTTPVTVLTEVGRIKMPLAIRSGLGVALPTFCNSQGTIFLRLVSQTGGLDLISISADGKAVTRFDKGRITELDNPRLGTFFVAGNDLYVEAIAGREPQAATVMTPGKDGSATSQKAVRYKSARNYIVHFKTDGSYLGAVPVDLDFRILRFGVFPSGEFLVAGAEYAPPRPRLALLQSNGQLLRDLEPEGDVKPNAPQFKVQDGQPQPPLRPPETFLRVLISSAIAPDGNELILVRPGSDPRIYSVNAAGEITRQKFQMPGKFYLHGVIATPSAWVAQFWEPARARGIEFSLFSVDRHTGVATNAYQYPEPVGVGLVCSDGTDFVFLRQLVEPAGDSLTIIRAEPSRTAAPTALPR